MNKNPDCRAYTHLLVGSACNQQMLIAGAGFIN